MTREVRSRESEVRMKTAPIDAPFTKTSGSLFKYVIVAALLTGAAVGAVDQTPRIEKEVRHELLMLPYVGVFDNLAYSVDGANVVLSGQVTKPIMKKDAGNVVKSIDGVEKVDNQIEVLPLSPHDDRLRAALFRAIYGDPSLTRYAMPVIKPIRIIVKNGNVTLEGVVDSEGDKSIASVRALAVHGVFSVTNQLRVDTAGGSVR
jgi:hyperosmotically inducible protein